jgi:hypothetical protein
LQPIAGRRHRRPLAPQVTALPPLAAYHDLRWLFAFNQSWLGFTGVLVLLVVARSAVDAVLVMLAWPDEAALPRPRFLGSLVSCAVLTVLTGLVMSPVVTLMFGVALLPSCSAPRWRSARAAWARPGGGGCPRPARRRG